MRKIRQTALEEWHLVKMCEKDIQKQIVFFFIGHNMYLEPFKMPTTGLSNVSICDIMVSLMSTYEQVTFKKIDEAQSSAKQPWDPSQPFQVKLNQIKKAADIVKVSGEQFLEQQLLRLVYTAAINTGLFSFSLKNEGVQIQ